MVVFLLLNLQNIQYIDLNIFSLATISCPMSSSRPRCRAVLCARQRGESLCSLLHPACAQWDQQPSLHMAFQDKGKWSQHLELSINRLQSINSSTTFVYHSLFIGWLPAWLPHGEPCCHEPTTEQHLQSGGGAPCSLWFVNYPPLVVIHS